MGVYNVVDPNTGKTIDCDSWGNIFNLTCWGVNSQNPLSIIPGFVSGPYANYVPPASTAPGGATSDPSVTGQDGVPAGTSTADTSGYIAPSSALSNPIVLAAVGFGAAALIFSMVGRR